MILDSLCLSLSSEDRIKLVTSVKPKYEVESTPVSENDIMFIRLFTFNLPYKTTNSESSSSVRDVELPKLYDIFGILLFLKISNVLLRSFLSTILELKILTLTERSIVFLIDVNSLSNKSKLILLQSNVIVESCVNNKSDTIKLPLQNIIRVNITTI